MFVVFLMVCMSIAVCSSLSEASYIVIVPLFIFFIDYYFLDVAEEIILLFEFVD